MASTTTHIFWTTMTATEMAPMFACRRGVAALRLDGNVQALVARCAP